MLCGFLGGLGGVMKIMSRSFIHHPTPVKHHRIYGTDKFPFIHEVNIQFFIFIFDTLSDTNFTRIGNSLMRAMFHQILYVFLSGQLKMKVFTLRTQR